MKERLLNVKELIRLINLGYFKYYDKSKQTVILTQKATTRFKEKVCSFGFFYIEGLETLQGMCFRCPGDKSSYGIVKPITFTMANYKFYSFWKKILNTNTFKRIEI